MVTFSCAIEIAAPCAWLFETMQDYERRLAWDEFLSSATLCEGATRAGTGVRALCIDLRGRAMETEYVSFDPPRRAAVKMTRGPWMFASFAGSWSYREIAPLRTEVTFRYGMSLRPRIVGRLGDRLLAGVFAREMEKRLASAKTRLERLYADDASVRG